MATKRKGYIEVLPQMLKLFKEDLAEEIQDYRVSGLPKGAGHYYSIIETTCKDIAIGELMVNKDVAAAKKYFYMSAMMRKIMIEKIDAERYIAGDSFYTGCIEEDAIYMALLSDKEGLAEELAKISGKRKSNEIAKSHSQIFVGNVLYAIKNILLDKLEDAKSNVTNIQCIRDSKYMKRYVDVLDILQAITENDEETLNKSLQHFASMHNKLTEYKDSPDETMSLHVLGLAKLAIRQGLNVSIDHPKAPAKILEHMDIEYPVIDFVD